MPKKAARPKRSAIAAPLPDRWLRAVPFLLAVAVAGALLAVDRHAEAAFDAPKRLVAMIAVASALAAAIAGDGFSLRSKFKPSAAMVIAICFGLAVVFVTISAFVSIHRAVALDSLRPILLFATVPLIAAIDSISARIWRSVAISFVGASAINAAVSLLQSRHLITLFDYATIGGRSESSAFIGNDGLLGLTLAFAATLVLAELASSRRRRIGLACLALLLIAGVWANQGITSLLVLVAGSFVVVIDRFGFRRAMAAILIAAGVATGAFVRTSRGREMAALVRSGDRNAILSYRIGAWRTAAKMIDARPVAGTGPGTFGLEFVPRRISADLGIRHRLINPQFEGSFTEAHCDYLQAAAELGTPAAITGSFVLFALLVLTWLARLRMSEESQRDATAICATLVAGAIAAAAWFPMQRAATALLILLACGRAWRLIRSVEAEEA